MIKFCYNFEDTSTKRCKKKFLLMFESLCQYSLNNKIIYIYFFYKWIYWFLVSSNFRSTSFFKDLELFSPTLKNVWRIVRIYYNIVYKDCRHAHLNNIMFNWLLFNLCLIITVSIFHIKDIFNMSLKYYKWYKVNISKWFHFFKHEITE